MPKVTGVPGTLRSTPGTLVPAAIGSIGIPLSNAVWSVSLAPPAWTVDPLVGAWSLKLAPAAWRTDPLASGWSVSLPPPPWD